MKDVLKRNEAVEALPLEARLLSNIRLLLNQIGSQGNCRGCGADIWWVVYKSGKKAPITAEALNHFADCPNRDQFKNGPKTEGGSA